MTFPLLIVLAPLTRANINPAIHKMCSDVKDYAGCVRTLTQTENSNDGNENEITVSAPKEYSYDKDSIRQYLVRKKFGRYLVFTGRTLNEYSGTSGYYNPGSSGTINCTSTGNSYSINTSCSEIGGIDPTYIPPTRGGTQRNKFWYELDCQDKTFDRKGDLKTSGGFKKGWMHISQDPVAEQVAKKYCPIITEIPVYGYEEYLSYIIGAFNLTAPLMANLPSINERWEKEWGPIPDFASEKELAESRDKVNKEFRKGNFKKAISIHSVLMDKYPNDVNLNLNALHLLQAQHDFLGVIDLASQYIRRFPKNANINSAFYYYRGNAHFLLGNIDRAIFDYQKAGDTRPESYIVMGAKANLFGYDGTIEGISSIKKDACNDIDKLLKVDTNLGKGAVRSLKKRKC
ncbi:hypothetical protein OA162_01700 [Synechococcus sp. AH-736-A19]|nr:hypothetical protein [Synechococcus sp. AH-736-A19]